jgi:hypothetical protein
MTSEEKPHTVADGTHELSTRLDELMAPLHFRELLDMAVDICLTREPNYPGEFNLVGEAAIVAHLGTRGVKAALELSQPTTSMESNTNDHELEDKKAVLITLDTPLRAPTFFSRSINPEILAETGAFGEELMVESFRILGQDAYKKVEEFKNASSNDEQLDVIDWLNDRLLRITDGSGKFLLPEKKSDDDSDKHFYHPARLSPKLVGTYPKHALQPTCLGVSIIAAGFFRRAGANIMHGDVVRTDKENKAANAAAYIRDLRAELGGKFDLSPPNAIQDSVDKIHTQLVKTLEREEAHHSVLYIQLRDGHWAQFDSNYDASEEVRDEKANETLNRTYENLQELAPYAPGVEIAAHLRGSIDRGEISREILELQDTAASTEVMFKAFLLLRTGNAESLAQKVYNECIEPFFEPSADDNDRLRLMKSLLRSEELLTSSGRIESHLQLIFYKLFNKYVLWGEDSAKVVEQSQHDLNYLINRSLDVAILPFLMMASLSSSKVEKPAGDRIHTAVELGLPEQRIGLAVLSDFAVYTDSPLPPSFWLSHWPSHVSVFETIDGASHSSYEDSMVYNNVVHRQIHPLTPARNYDIISTFRDLRKPTKEEDTDG